VHGSVKETYATNIYSNSEFRFVRKKI